MTMDFLKVGWKEPEVRDALTILVIVGANTGRHFLSKAVGMGSRSHCLSGEDFMARMISSTVAGRKDARLDGGNGGFGICGDSMDGGIAD